MSAGSPDRAAHRNGPCPRRTAGGCTPARTPGTRTPGRSRPGLVADRVAVVEDLRPRSLELHHRPDVRRHRLLRRLVNPTSRPPARTPSPRRRSDRQVEQRVVRRGLVGDDVDRRLSRSSGSITAALPRTPIDSGRRSSRAATAIATASSSDAACTSRNRCSIRRVIRDWSHSMQMTTPSFIVTASGWAPPMPPSPAVSVIVPASVLPPSRAGPPEIGRSPGSSRGDRACRDLVRHGRERLERALQDPRCRCRSTSRPSSGRTSSARGPRAAGTPPSWPSPAPLEFAISTRGPTRVRITPTGFPDWTSMVSSSSRSRSVRTSASYDSQLRAALPVPPYTTRSSGRSAFSGSRLFISIRSGASVCHDFADRSTPGAWMGGRRSALVELVGSACRWSSLSRPSVQFSDHFFDGVQDRPGADQLHGGVDLGHR